jgi:hypothetical protein
VRRLLTSEHGFTLPVTREREGRGLEARRAVGHLLGGWSQWGNRLPHEA